MVDAWQIVHCFCLWFHSIWLGARHLWTKQACRTPSKKCNNHGSMFHMFYVKQSDANVHGNWFELTLARLVHIPSSKHVITCLCPRLSYMLISRSIIVSGTTDLTTSCQSDWHEISQNHHNVVKGNLVISFLKFLQYFAPLCPTSFENTKAGTRTIFKLLHIRLHSALIKSSHSMLS